MPCTEPVSREPRRSLLLGALGVLAGLIAGCASQAPAPAPARPAATAPAPAPAAPAVRPAAPPAAAPAVAAPAPATAPLAAGVNLGPRVALPAAPAVRNWDEFKKMAGRRMVAASPQGSYMGKPPPILFGIPILETELNADGTVRAISITRPPANPDAANTVEHAMEAIRRGAPYGDMSRLPKPWKWTEVFLFNDQRQFKPRSLE